MEIDYPMLFPIPMCDLKCLALSNAHVISIIVDSLLESISLPEWGANSRRQSLVQVGVTLHKGSVFKFVNLDFP